MDGNHLVHMGSWGGGKGEVMEVKRSKLSGFCCIFNHKWDSFFCGRNSGEGGSHKHTPNQYC